MTIRTRFAPSPTGYLHVGGARTALFSWLYAKRHKGEYILRIEDTDRERSTQEAVDAIIDGLAWLGLKEDEGPFFQTQRMDRYHEVIQQWLKEEKAYRCYCSKERLEALREQQMAAQEKPRYDGHCRDHAPTNSDASYAIRFKNPKVGSVEFDDQVLGKITVHNSELDDLIIARSDGMPTYNFTVVVDDYDMKITHVIRGNDHVNNTPRQINMLKAMGATPPLYAHIPMILGDDGKRLSKRHGAVSVLQYREMGFLPQALLNYLVRLGWSHGDQEIFSLEEMIQFFDFDHVNKAACSFNTEKLIWLNQHYIRSLPIEIVEKELAWHFEKLQIDPSQGCSLAELIAVQKERCKTLREMAEESRYFYQDNIEYSEEATKKHFTPEAKPALKKLEEKLQALPNWEKTAIHQAIQATGEELGLKLGKYGPAIRVAVTGDTKSPALDDTLLLLGKTRSLSRLKAASL